MSLHLILVAGATAPDICAECAIMLTWICPAIHIQNYRSCWDTYMLQGQTSPASRHVHQQSRLLQRWKKHQDSVINKRQQWILFECRLLTCYAWKHLSLSSDCHRDSPWGHRSWSHPREGSPHPQKELHHENQPQAPCPGSHQHPAAASDAEDN